MSSLELSNQPEIVSYEAMRQELWRRGQLSWKLWEQQKPIYQGLRALRGITEVVVLCARQFGKSHLGVLLAIEDCLRYPGKCVLLMGPTLKQTTDIAAPRVKEIIKDAPAGLIRRSKSESKWLIGDSELVIGGFDINSSSQRGKTVQSIYVEEVVDSHPDSYIESMRSDLAPALTHSIGGMMVFLTTLPKIPDHPFITETLTRAQAKNALYTYTIDDNRMLSPEQYAACVERCGGKNTIDFRREYLCELVRDSSLVIIPAFDELKHVSPANHHAMANAQLTIDWGGVRDLTAAILHIYDYQTSKTYIIDEMWWAPNTPTQRIVDDLRDFELRHSDRYPVSARIVDCPGQLITDLIQTHNFDCRLPPKDDWQAAVNNLAVAFANNQIIVDPRCKLLIQTLRSGTFNRNKTDFDRTLNLGHCDMIASLMYAWRTQLRQDTHQRITSDWSWVPPRKDDNEDLSNAVAPKVFANSFSGLVPKKFGSFSR